MSPDRYRDGGERVYREGRKLPQVGAPPWPTLSGSCGAYQGKGDRQDKRDEDVVACLLT